MDRKPTLALWWCFSTKPVVCRVCAHCCEPAIERAPGSGSQVVKRHCPSHKCTLLPQHTHIHSAGI